MKRRSQLALIGLGACALLVSACDSRRSSSGSSNNNSNSNNNANNNDSADCFECNESVCASELSDCRADATCGDYYDCYIACDFDDVDCLLGCTAQISGGNTSTATISAVSAVQTCAATNCYDECTVDVELGDDTSGDDTSGDDTSGDDTPQPPVPGTGFDTHDGGYITVGSDLAGYAWTAADTGSGSHAWPEDYDDMVAGDGLCSDGIVYATEDFSGVALMGFNVNEEWGDSDVAPGTWSPSSSSSGIHVTTSGSSDNGIRVQIQGPTGASDPDARWCYTLTSSSTTIPWSSFNTECWDGGGNDYDGEPIESIMLLIPGEDFDNVNFDICLLDVAIE